jgi:hypothetical protein
MTAADDDGFEELVEKALCFRFRRSVWRAIKWDGHAAQQRIERLDGTKAVEFLALHTTLGLHFIEVKDHRQHTRSKEKGPIEIEFAKKVRDAVAGLVAAARRDDTLAPELLPFAQALMDRRTPVKAVLWEETPPNVPPVGLRDRIANKLQWLTTKVIVTNQRLRGLPDVDVRNLPYEDSE